jgi:hypothetical protein
MNRYPQFDLVFKNIDVQRANKPNFQIFFSTKLINRNEYSPTELVKLGIIKYDATIHFINKEFTLLLTRNLDTQYTFHSSMISDINSIDTSIVLNFSNEVLLDIIEYYIAGNRIEIKINATIEYELLDNQNNHFIIRIPRGIHASYIHDDKRSASILLNSDMIDDIINKNEAKITIPITIPLPKLESKISELSKAITNLQKVSTNYTSGSFGDFLINIRNIVLNDLTELATDPNNPKNSIRVLKKQIVSECIDPIPLELQGDYEKIVNNVGKMTTELLKNIHTFVHENNDKILRYPFAGDMELMYYSICLIIRYLHRISNNNLHIIKP